MFKNFFINKNGILMVFFLLVISFAPFMWGFDINKYQFIGGGDFISLMNIKNIITERLFVYNPFSMGGMDYSFISAHLFPFYFFYWIFSFFNISPLITTLTFISIIIFVSQVSMYFWLTYVFEKKLEIKKNQIKIWSFFGSIIYGFSPFLVGLIQPGHMLLLLSYSLFPLLLINYDLFLFEKKIKPLRLLYIFILLFFHASAFANVGVIYTLVIVFFFYSICIFYIYKIELRRIAIRLLILISLIFASNSWWLLPFISTIIDAYSINRASSTITASIGQATEKASIVNIFLSKAEYLFYADIKFGKYIGLLFTSLFSILFIFFSFYLVNIRKNKYLLVLLCLLILGLTVSKGDKAPFQEIFLLFYEYMPGFQVFRRPVSKFYWVFYFAYITISLIGVSYLEHTFKNKFRKAKLISIAYFFIISSFLIFNFVTTPPMRVFNIPSYYFKAGKQLESENVNKVMILPGIYGNQPIYNESVNRYGGVDFLEYIWRFSVTTPDSTNYSLELPYKKPLNRLNDRIRSNQPFCQHAKEMGITHIMVREDLWEKQSKQDPPSKLISILDKHPDVKNKKTYSEREYKGFNIYSLNNECSTGIIHLSDKNATLNYLYKNPTAIEISIKNLTSPAELSLLNNFSKSWKIYESKDAISQKEFDNKNYFSNNIIFDFTEIFYLFKNPFFEDSHKISNNFANSWEINSAVFNADGISRTTNSDKSINLNLTLIYKPQLYLYLGTIITSLSFISISALSMISKIKKPCK